MCIISIIYTLILLLSIMIFIKSKPVIIGAGFIFNAFYMLFYYTGSIYILYIFQEEDFYKKLKYLLIIGIYIISFNIGYILGRKKNVVTNKLYILIIR